MTAPDLLREPQLPGPRLPFEAALGLGIGFVALALLGLLLFATADFLLDALRRTGRGCGWRSRRR